MYGVSDLFPRSRDPAAVRRRCRHRARSADAESWKIISPAYGAISTLSITVPCVTRLATSMPFVTRAKMV